jgi:hypothetical protein
MLGLSWIERFLFSDGPLEERAWQVVTERHFLPNLCVVWIF